VTMECIAECMAKTLQKCNVVIDPFAGVGGNVIQLARFCDHVIAIEIDEVRLLCAKRNAEVYGVADKIEFIHGNAMSLLPMLKVCIST
jgi:trimethylguanosine synthase